MFYRQNGNVLFLILIAVALFAALSYAVTRSSSGGSNISKESSILVAQEFLNFGNSVRTGVQRMTIIGGIDVENISFSKNGSGPLAIFSSDGGGVAWQDPPLRGCSASCGWNFSKPSDNWGSWGVGTDASGTGGEAFIWALNIDPDVCKAINQTMGYDYEIPNDPTSAALPNTMTAYEGAWAYCFTDSGGPPELIYILEDN